MDARLTIRLEAEDDFAADILVGAKMLAQWEGLPMKKTKGWQEIDLGIVQLRKGDNIIRFSTHNAEVKIDYFKLEPVMPVKK